MAGLSGVVEVSVGHNYNVWVRMKDGTISGWGNTLSMPGPDFPYETDAVEVGAGGDFADARSRSHQVSCWGAGTFGSESSYVAQRMEGLSGVKNLRLSINMAAATLEDGTARIWGPGRKVD